MTIIDKSIAPYYDDYAESKKFIQILANPGNVAQAREFTQIQTMFLDFLKRGLNVFLKNGDIIEGCNVTIKGTTVKVTSGKIYVDGVIQSIPSATLTILGEGDETIGAVVNETIVTSATDTSLLDPALGQVNYQQPGADRLKREITFTVNDDSAIPVYRLRDGMMLNTTIKPELEKMTEVLARRTFDESGNYRIRGFKMYGTVAKDENDVEITDKIAIKIAPGKAYVKGFEVMKTVTNTILVDKSTETREVLGEEYTYESGKQKYQLLNTPVSSVTSVVATVEETDQPMTKGVANGIDYPRNTSEQITDIIRITAGGTEYVEGTDFQLSGNGINWSLGGAEPATGSLYYVTYRYKRIMATPADYTVTAKGEVDFTPAGINPVVGTPIIIDYLFYLARTDVISLAQDGSFIVTKGQSDIPRLVQEPKVDASAMLPLAYVYISPSSTSTVVTDVAVNSVSMKDLSNAIRRIEELEYNQAVQELEREAMAGEDTTMLKGIFSEGFISTGRADIPHPDFTAGFDLESGEMIVEQKPYLGDFNMSQSSTAVKTGKLVTSPYTEVAFIKQPYATGQLNVNPYDVFTRRINIAVSPAVDNWIDTDKMTLEDIDTVASRIKRWWTYEDEDKILAKPDNPFDPELVEKPKTVSKSIAILDSAITYMRQRTITVSITGCSPNADNLTAYFDGKKVFLTPKTGTVAGTSSGTVKANASGFASATFVVPANTRTGVKEVKVVTSAGNGYATYTSTGRKRRVDEAVFTRRTANQGYDPIAQSFGFLANDTLLTSVGLYFAAKDSAETVRVQIRDLVNGAPGTTILAEKVLSAGSISTSANGTVETKVTFEEPVFLEAMTGYCVVLLTTSPNYSVFVATLDQKDLSTNKLVSNQPYAVGTMFTSSTAVSWTPNQTMDLKFTAYIAKFTAGSSSQLLFNKETSLNIDEVLAAVNSIVPVGTKIVWEVMPTTAQGDGKWLPITPYAVRNLGAVTTGITLRATLTTTSIYISPIISLDGALYAGFQSATSASYISKMITLAQPTTTLRQVVEVYLPSNSSLQLQYKTRDVDGNGDPVGWTTINLSGATLTQTSDGWYRYELATTIPSTETIRLKLTVKATTVPPDPLQRPILRAKARKFMNILK